MCRRNTQQAQARQRKKFDKKAAGAKAYSVGDYVWLFQNVIPPKGTKKLLKKWRGPFMITDVHQNLEPDLPFTIQIRQKDGTRPRKKYNPYGDDFVVDRIDLKKIVEEVVGLEEITVSQDIDIVDDHDDEWVDDQSKPEVEFDDEQQQSYEQDLTSLRVLEWLN